MNISTRITEYSITGGLLWVNVLLFAILLNLPVDLPVDQFNLDTASQKWAAWIDAMAPLKDTLAVLPSGLQSSLGTLLGALVIIVIFFSGIVLDLIAPVFFLPIELYFFRKWLIQKNRGWLDRLIAANGEFIAADYQTFIDGRVRDWKRPMAWFEQRRCFQKVSAFMLSHIMVFSQASALEELMDRVHLWRTSRAISTSMVVLAVLLTFFYPLGPVSHGQGHDLRLWMIATIIPLLLTLISALITLGTYSRMCLSLCSLTYSTMRREAAA
jgi:hypothetical protein